MDCRKSLGCSIYFVYGIKNNRECQIIANEGKERIMGTSIITRGLIRFHEITEQFKWRFQKYQFLLWFITVITLWIDFKNDNEIG